MQEWDGGWPVTANGRQYQPVAASQIAALLGAVGAIGDTLDQLWLMPATTAPGTVIVLDGALPVWTWPAGITVTSLAPIFIPLNLRSVAGGWNITTGADVAVLASGAFSEK